MPWAGVREEGWPGLQPVLQCSSAAAEGQSWSCPELSGGAQLPKVGAKAAGGELAECAVAARPGS